MINSDLIKSRIEELGYTQASVAEQLGMTRCTLTNKINNVRKMYLYEALDLAKILKISSSEFSLFFDHNVPKRENN